MPVVYLRHALRYRPWQTAVLAGVSLLIASCAAFGPWFARAVEQSVTASELTQRRTEAAWHLYARSQPVAGQQPVTAPPDYLDSLRPESSKARFETPVAGMFSEVGWRASAGRARAEGRITWRDGFCDHLTIEDGRCPTARNEVAVSTADRDNYHVRIGDTLDAAGQASYGGGKVRVTGFYTADRTDPYWYGTEPVGRSFPQEERPSLADFLFTPRETFEKGLWQHTSVIDTAPRPGLVRVDELDELVRTTNELSTTLDELHPVGSALLDTRVQQVVDDIDAARKQARTIIPLVMAQVALFGLVVLGLAAAAVTDQRRPEIAIARLRGQRPVQAGRAVVIQLGVPVLAGTVAGIGVAFGLVAVVRSAWLSGSAPLEWRWAAAGAAILAAIAGLGGLALAVRRVVRNTVSTLLRTVPPRRRTRLVGLTDVVIITLALAGLLSAVSGDGQGPLAILTPTLLSLAIGLAAGHLLLWVASYAGPRALRGGRLAFGLGVLQIGRRAAVTRIVAVVAVATALVAFAGQASSIATRNRDARAGYEIGAAAVLQLSTEDAARLPQLLGTIDPERRWLTPVLVTIPPAAEALSTLMIEPDSFRRIAYGADRMADAATYDAIRAPDDEGIELRGTRLEVTASGTGQPTKTEPPRKAELRAVVVGAGGYRATVRLGDLVVNSDRQVTLGGHIGCASAPCRLLRFEIAPLLDEGEENVLGTINLRTVRTDTAAVDLGGAGDWHQAGPSELPEESIDALGGNGGGLGIEVDSRGGTLGLQHDSVPSPVPAVISNDHTFETSQTTPAVDGTALPVAQAGTATGPVPRYLQHTAVVDLQTVLRSGGVLDPAVTGVSLWLNEDGLAHQDEIVAALRQKEVSVAVTDRLADREEVYARSASALALRLTPVIGAAAWSLAIIVLLLLAVTTWRSRAHDHASLRIAGVPRRVTAGAARWEQTAPVAIAATLGTACGVAGAQLALPLIPLFATDVPQIPQDLGIDWRVALLAWLVSTALLLVTAVAVGIGLTRRATYDRLTEEVQ